MRWKNILKTGHLKSNFRFTKFFNPITTSTGAKIHPPRLTRCFFSLPLGYLAVKLNEKQVDENAFAAKLVLGLFDEIDKSDSNSPARLMLYQKKLSECPGGSDLFFLEITSRIESMILKLYDSGRICELSKKEVSDYSPLEEMFMHTLKNFLDGKFELFDSKMRVLDAKHIENLLNLRKQIFDLHKYAELLTWLKDSGQVDSSKVDEFFDKNKQHLPDQKLDRTRYTFSPR